MVVMIDLVTSDPARVVLDYKPRKRGGTAWKYKQEEITGMSFYSRTQN